MSHCKAYPAYKDSGVEWLGPVPEHWEVSSLKYLVSAIDSGTSVNATDTPAREGEFGVLKTSCVYSGTFDPAENKAIVLEEYGRVSCPLVVGSLIVSRMNTPDLVGAAGLVRHAPDGIFLPDRLWQVSFSGMMPTFSYYWSQSDSYRTQVKKVCTGTSSSMQNLSQDQFKDFVLGVPAEGEQQLITAHLDRETARIDALIEKKTRFIQLLREKRQALITHAVTKGLNPNVKVKDSGVEWLGEVPEHWAVCKLSFRYSVELGKMLDGKQLVSTNLMPYLRNQDVQWGVVNTEGLPEMDIYPDELSRYTVRAGDLLVCEGGDVGRAAIWRGKSDVIGYQKALHRLRPRNDAMDTAEFLLFALMAAKLRGVFEESDSRATIAHLPAEKFRQYRFAFPSAHEQCVIANHLRTHAWRLDEVQVKTERSIALLKERRSALITAAVTGQIDLREAV